MAALCIISTSYDRLRNMQTPHWYCLTLSMLHHFYLHPYSLMQGGIPLTLVSPTSSPLALTASLFPTLHQPCTHPSLETHGEGVRCQTNSLLTPSHSVDTVEAFERTTATSACAMVTKRQAHTHPLDWAFPASLLSVCTAPPPCPCGAHFSNY